MQTPILKEFGLALGLVAIYTAVLLLIFDRAIFGL
jgi:hypothetical protein